MLCRCLARRSQARPGCVCSLPLRPPAPCDPAEAPRSAARAGTYWGKDGGCIAGEWRAGVLTGEVTFDVPAWRLEARFARGLPHGPCHFTAAAFRELPAGNAPRSFPAAAAAHIRAAAGPVLQAAGEYALPAGVPLEVAARSAGDDDEEGGDGDGGGDAPPLPAAPRYEGLSFTAAHSHPAAAANMAFPPAAATVPACIAAPAFAMHSAA